MTPQEIVNKMMAADHFSQWLGIEVKEVRNGYCLLEMGIRKEMLNGFGIAHGGITFSLADSALAFASNSNGIKSLSIDTSIAHISGLKEGDRIVAEALRETETEKLGHYRVKIHKMEHTDKPVALFKGIVYKTSHEWD